MAKSRDEIVSDPTQPSLLDLPNELLLPIHDSKDSEISITSGASKSDAINIMGQLSTTCRTLHTLFKPTLNHILQQEAEELLQYVVKPTKENVVKAKTMYEKNPQLLFIEGTAIADAADLNGVHRTIVASPYRAALGAGDILLIDEMNLVIDTYIDPQSKKTGREIAQEQFAQQFPNGVDFPPSTYDFSALEKAISNDFKLINPGQRVAPGKTSAGTERELVKFRDHFKPTVVKVGHHFNMNDLVKVRKIYCTNKNWNVAQNVLFWSQVHGFLQRLVSGVGGQILSYGLNQFLEKPSSFQRDCKMDTNITFKKLSYFPLDTDQNYRLGLHLGINNWGVAQALGGASVGWTQLIEYAEQIQSALKKLSVVTTNKINPGK